jgi:Lysylphosphatidylglycerol synthase TM region
VRRFHLFSIITGAVLLGVLMWAVGLRELWRELSLLGSGLIPLILIEGASDILHAFGWRHCLSGSHRDLSIFRIFNIRLAGSSINYLTPTADLAGEVTKGTLLSMNHPGPEAVTGVIIGKLSYALSKLLFVGAGSLIILLGIELPAGVWMAMLTGSALLGAGILGFLAVQKYGKLGAMVRWLVSHRLGEKTLEKSAERITEVDAALRLFYRQYPWELPRSVFWHILGMACGIVQGWYFLFLLSDRPSLALAAGVWFLGSWLDLLSFPIPMSLGVLEGSRVIVFKLLGFQSAVGLSYGVALRLEQIFWAGVGLLVYWTLLAERRGGLSENPSLEK